MIFEFVTQTEPIGSVAPKVTLADKFTYATVHVDHVTGLLCPIQGFPTPAYRLV